MRLAVLKISTLGLLSHFALVALLPQVAVASAPTCSRVFSVERTRATPYARLASLARRSQLIDELKQNKLPAFLKETEHGPIPVILVNDETIPALDRLMKASVGLQTLLQPGTQYTDHGLIRIGYTQMDWAMPDSRGGHPLELHSSGISWRDIREKLRRAALKNDDHKVTMEVAYVVTPQQRSALEYWHRVRRSTMIAVKSENWQGEMKPDVPNTYPDWLFEGCFNFCNVDHFAQLRDLTIEKLKELSVSDPESLMQAPLTKLFIKESRAALMKLNANDAWWFHHRSLYENPALQARFVQLLKENKLQATDDVQLENIFNTIIAYDALIGAHQVLRQLDVRQNNSATANLDNPNVVGILVYAPAHEAPRFRNATFTTGGFYEGTGWGADSHGTKPFDDQYPLRRRKK